MPLQKTLTLVPVLIFKNRIFVHGKATSTCYCRVTVAKIALQSTTAGSLQFFQSFEDEVCHNLQHLHSCFVGGPSLRISRGRRKACRECGGGGEEEERSAQLWGEIQREHIPNHPANNGNGKMREKVGTRRIRDEQHKSQNAETRTRWRAYHRKAQI